MLVLNCAEYSEVRRLFRHGLSAQETDHEREYQFCWL